MIEGAQRICCVVAHPDDAEIAAGGTLALLAEQGRDVIILCATVSEESGELATQRKRAAHSAADRLGVALAWIAGARYNQVDEISPSALVAYIDEFLSEFRPDLIITHSATDSHHDHRQLHDAVISASRRTYATLLCMQPAEHRAPSFLQFAPNFFVDISKSLPKKVAAITEYSYDGQSFRQLNVKAILAINSFFGIIAGYEYAEAFTLVRHRASS